MAEYITIKPGVVFNQLIACVGACGCDLSHSQGFGVAHTSLTLTPTGWTFQCYHPPHTLGIPNLIHDKYLLNTQTLLIMLMVPVRLPSERERLNPSTTPDPFLNYPDSSYPWIKGRA